MSWILVLLVLLNAIVFGWILLRSGGRVRAMPVLRGMALTTIAAAPATKRGGNESALTVAGVNIPSMVEYQHFLFSGTTGSGKTQGICQVLAEVQRRKARAMLADAGGAFLSRFHRPGDFIFNPFDKRSVDWSPFAEIRADYDCARIAKATIPDADGEAKQWNHYAQTLLGELMLALHKAKIRSVKRLLYYLTVAEGKELQALLEGTPAATLCNSANDRMLASTRSVIASFILPWRYLQDQGNFSIRDWIRDESSTHWLYVTHRDDQSGTTRSLVATILEIALVEGLSLPEQSDRDLWFIMDEVDSLGKISSLRDSLAKMRKHGCKCVLGLQTISQLRSTYGEAEAQTLMANVATKIILRAGDGETAEYFSKEIGDQVVARTEVSSSFSWTGGRSTSKRKAQDTQRTVLGSEIASLPDLRGYLKTPPGTLMQVAIPYARYAEATPSFVDRQ